MGAYVTPPLTGTVEPPASSAALTPDLVHRAVVRTGGAEFAVGWVDDTQAPTTPGAERQKEG